MRVNNINLKPVVEFAKIVGKVVLFGTLLNAVDKAKNMASYSSETTKYSDAVDAIMRSDMFSSDKITAVSVLNQYEDTDFYKAIINVANNTTMLSSYKVEMIEQLCGKNK